MFGRVVAQDEFLVKKGAEDRRFNVRPQRGVFASLTDTVCDRVSSEVRLV